MEGDKVTCQVPDVIRLTSGATTSGRLRDTTADWDSEHDGVGDYVVTEDEDGHKLLTITYDDGYVAEKSGKILSTTVRLSGGFDLTGKSTDAFDESLIFGNVTANVTFSKLEIVRNLSIEKTGAVTENGPSVFRSTPTYPRQGGAEVDSDGYLTYSVTVTAGEDNTYKLTNVKVTDLFDSDSQSKVDLSTMTLVSVVNDGTDTTSQAAALYDGANNINGWNIGDLGIGSSAVVTFKVKINKTGVTTAVDAEKAAAKASEASTDAADARTIKNTATASADGAAAVSDDYSTVLKNYLATSKSSNGYDWTTQTQNFKITVSAPSDNRYTMHNVPIYDYLSNPLDSGYYKESGIKSITVKHSDGNSESLQWNDFYQATTTSWYATIPEIQPGDVVTINAYLTFDDSYWTRNYSNGGYAGDSNTKWNYVNVGNVGSGDYKYQAPDLNKVNDYSTFTVNKVILAKNSPTINSDGTINWVITGNENRKSATPENVGGLVLNDSLGPDQVFEGGTATVTFYDQDNKVAGTDTIELTAGSTTFSYTIPSEYGTCKYVISYTSKITDWDTYIGPAKSYSNSVNNWTSYTYKRARVAAMDKSFVKQADDWSEWKTSVYSELENGDTYEDTSRYGISYMYFTQEDLDAITLTLDGVAVDSGLYQIGFSDTLSGDKHNKYKITFKGDVAVTKDGKTVKPSKTTPLVISYKAHMVDPSAGSRTYYNDATLTAGNVIDTDYDYCARDNSKEILKKVTRSSNGTIVWEITSNYYGYSGQADGTCTITDTLPAGLSYVSATVKDGFSARGKIDSVTSTSNDDGTTTLAINISGLKHDEVCKAHTYNNNSNYYFCFLVTTKITDPEYLYGSTSKTFSYVNNASLSDRYGHLKQASATASMEHVALQKNMSYSEATAPYAQFSILANKDKIDLNPDGDAVGIVDVTSKTLSVDAKSISVVDATTGDPVEYTVDASKMSENKFTIYVPDGTYVKISYQAQVLGVAGQDVQVSNSAYYEAYKSTSDENTINKTVTVFNSSGESESEPMVWLAKKDESAAALGGAMFKLESYNQTTKQWTTLRTGIESNSSTTSKGTKIESLELSTLYRLVETAAPEGYVLDQAPHYFVLARESVPSIEYPDGVDEDDVFVGAPGSVINAYNLPYTKVRFAKNSSDGVQLAGAQFSVYEVSSDGSVGTAPAKDADGNDVTFVSSATDFNEVSLAPGTYQLKETAAPAGYKIAEPITFVVAGNADRVVTVNGQTVQSGTGDSVAGAVTMTDETETTSLKVTKAWNDANNQDGKRPGSVTVQLYADDEAVEGSTAVVSAEGPDGVAGTEDDWTADFSGLDVMKAGKVISYTVKELDPETQQSVDSGTKMSSGYTVSVGTTAGNVADGTDEGYSVVVTNSYETAKTSLAVTKSWNDVDDQAGKRADVVTVQLCANGQAVAGKTLELTESNSWAASFTGLDAYEGGNAISYTVKEIDPQTGEAAENGSTLSNGYTVTVDGTAGSADEGYSVTLTNSYTPGAVAFTVTKIWDDCNDFDKVRPASVTVQLYANGEAVEGKTIELTENNGWTTSFTGLDAYKSGKAISYTVREIDPQTNEAVESGSTLSNGYTVTAGEVVGNADEGYSVTVTNSYEPAKTSLAVSKSWNDADDQDGKRPSSVTVQLCADGAAVEGKMLVLSNANGWSACFNDLDACGKDGNAISYTVSELDPHSGQPVKSGSALSNGYTVAVGATSGDASEGYSVVVTNSYTPMTTTFSVTKSWDDCNDFDKVRPSSVTVQLYANGQAVAGKTLELTESNGWAASFTGLDAYEGGNAISYTVKEIDPQTGEAAENGSALSNGYTVTVDGTAGNVDEGYSVTLTNSHEPAKTSVAVTKSWDDADDQDGKRPSSVTVQLYADGAAVEGKTLTLSSGNDWSASFMDLDACDKDGNTIVYSVKELDADNNNEPVEFGSQTKKGYTATLVSAVYAGYPEGVVPVESVTPDDQDAAKGKQDADNAGAQISRSISYSIKNTRQVEKTAVSVTKKWIGDTESSRPDSIAVELLKDGEVADTATIQADSNGEWTYVFADLDKYAQGKEIVYSVREAKVPSGYTSEVSGDAASGFVITNTKDKKPTTPGNKDSKDDGDTPDSSNSTGQSYDKTGAQAPVDNFWAIVFTAAGAATFGVLLIIFAARRPKGWLGIHKGVHSKGTRSK